MLLWLPIIIMLLWLHIIIMLLWLHVIIMLLWLQVVDMRWGVREEAEDDHMTTELCLKEIKQCQKLSVGPNFVVCQNICLCQCEYEFFWICRKHLSYPIFCNIFISMTI